MMHGKPRALESPAEAAGGDHRSLCGWGQGRLYIREKGVLPVGGMGGLIV